jgi:hypothetical protein
LADFKTGAQRELARLEEIIQAGKEAQKEATRLRTYLGPYADTANVPATNGKRKPRLTWIKRPENCILPTRFHERGANRKIAYSGLCSAHAQALNKGTLTDDENDAYDEALQTMRASGRLK